MDFINTRTFTCVLLVFKHAKPKSCWEWRALAGIGLRAVQKLSKQASCLCADPALRLASSSKCSAESSFPPEALQGCREPDPQHPCSPNLGLTEHLPTEPCPHPTSSPACLQQCWTARDLKIHFISDLKYPLLSHFLLPTPSCPETCLLTFSLHLPSLGRCPPQAEFSQAEAKQTLKAFSSLAAFGTCNVQMVLNVSK